MEHEVKVALLEESMKETNKRIDELQVVVKAFYELASDVKVMVNEMTNMKKDINDIKQKVDAYDSEPKKIIFNAKNTAITGFISAIVGAIIALILKK